MFAWGESTRRVLEVQFSPARFRFSVVGWYNSWLALMQYLVEETVWKHYSVPGICYLVPRTAEDIPLSHVPAGYIATNEHQQVVQLYITMCQPAVSYTDVIPTYLVLLYSVPERKHAAVSARAPARRKPRSSASSESWSG